MPVPAVLAALAGVGLGGAALTKMLPMLQKKTPQAVPQSMGEILGASQQIPSPTPTATPTPFPENPTFEDLLNYNEQKAKQEGFHPSPIASQMAAESARGQSRFAKERNNLFGMGSYDNDLDKTFRYDNPFQSIDSYYDLIKNDKRYGNAYEVRDDPYKYIQAIKDAGYATDPNYVPMISNTPEWRRYIQPQ